MTNRITKAMAEAAAKEMTKDFYSKKLQDVHKESKDYYESLLNKYVPAEVKEVAERYPEVFGSMSETRFHGVGHSTTNNWAYDVWGETITKNPLGTVKRFNLTSEEYETCCKFTSRIDNIHTEWEKKRHQIENALRQCGTEKKVKELFPEALPFLNFPSQCTALCPQFTELRTFVQTIIPQDESGTVDE